MPDPANRRLDAAVTVVVCAAVVGIAYWYERGNRRFAERHHPLALPRARLALARTNYRDRRDLVTEIAQAIRSALPPTSK